MKNFTVVYGKTINNIGVMYHLRRKFTTQAKTRLKTKNKGWDSVVGLEIHAQIDSKSKLFSGAGTSFTSPVNSSVAFFDCATPGTLPVLNRRCVEAGVLTALALSCNVNEVSLFDRKHYFYPDLPAGYQITQQRQPLAVNGEIGFQVFTPGVHEQPYFKTSKIKQIQLEQDSGKSLHDEELGSSLIDLNRAGIPLMELVFEPDLADGEEAAALVKELMIILQRLSTCSCKMEEGAFRVDANVSVNRPNEGLGTRTELKNIGSTRAVASAIKYEINRQISILEKGGEIFNETRTWDAEGKKTVSMRNKETKEDYRFMPEPNLPPLRLHMKEDEENIYNLVNVADIKTQIPEMPEETRRKLQCDFQLSLKTAIIFVREPILLQTFQEIMATGVTRNTTQVTNFLLMDVLKLLHKRKIDLEDFPFKSESIGELIDLLQDKKINLLLARKALNVLIDEPETSATEIIDQNSWYQINDVQKLEEICRRVIQENPKLVQKYQSKKEKIFNAFLGIIADQTGQKANMNLVTEILQKLLKK